MDHFLSYYYLTLLSLGYFISLHLSYVACISLRKSTGTLVGTCKEGCSEMLVHTYSNADRGQEHDVLCTLLVKMNSAVPKRRLVRDDTSCLPI